MWAADCLHGVTVPFLLMSINDPSVLCLHNLWPMLHSIDSTCHLFTTKHQGAKLKIEKWVNSWNLEIAKET